jgi:hypothetical protein
MLCFPRGINSTLAALIGAGTNIKLIKQRLLTAKSRVFLLVNRIQLMLAKVLGPDSAKIFYEVY